MEQNQGYIQQFWEKAPGRNWEKMIDLTSKLGKINNTKHYNGCKIYPQNQFIFRLFHAKYKCLSIILILVIVSHKYSSSGL